MAAVRGRNSRTDQRPVLLPGRVLQERSLAVDPRSLPLSEQLTDDARAAVIEVLERDSLYHDDTDQPRRTG